jgi:5-methylcytosine-specific restriction endonuclease McrA
VSATRADYPSLEERLVIHGKLRARDGKRCFYCRRHFKKHTNRRCTLDHYVPYSLWRGWDLANLVLACEACNCRKGDALPLTLAWLLLHTAGAATSRDSLGVAA